MHPNVQGLDRGISVFHGGRRTRGRLPGPLSARAHAVSLTLATVILCLAPSGSEADPNPEPVSCGDRCLISATGLVPIPEQVTLRPAPLDGNVEQWYSYSTRNLIPGLESIRQIWLELNRCAIGAIRQPLVSDPPGEISYHDPAWSADGRFLAYVQTDATSSSIYIQEFQLSLILAEAIVRVGAPRLVVAGGAGVSNRHPAWRLDGLELAFDSNASGSSIDLYTIAVDPSAPLPVPPPSPVQRTFNNNRAEQAPAYSPDGRRLAFTTNLFGPNVIEILDLGTGQITLAETNFRFVSHNNPRWSSDGRAILYDAPGGEDPTEPPRIWCLVLATQVKQQITSGSPFGDFGVDVSHRTNLTVDGTPFNYIVFASNLHAWRAANCCGASPTLDVTVDLDPNVINLKSLAPWVTAHIEPSGFDPASIDISTLRLAGSVPAAPKFAIVGDHDGNATPDLMVKFRREALDPLLTPGVNELAVTGSLVTGEHFEGRDEVRVIDPPNAPLSASVAPNPLNPAGVLTVRTARQGPVTVSMFDLHGRLVRRLLDRQILGPGIHEVRIDGRGRRGETLASGVYLYRVETVEGVLTGRVAILK